MESVNRYIEHTLLKPFTTDRELEQLIDEAKEHNFIGVCVPPFWVKKAKRDLGNADTQLVTVIGFPLGYQMTEAKIEEMKIAIDTGADELDIVLNISAFKTGMPWPKIELARCSKVAHDNYKLLKVIIETAYLNEEEIVKLCKICADAGVDFVKTSTGFAPEGAKKDHIALMRSCLPSNVGIKASGGIKNLAQATEMIQAGADRIGTSSGVSIMKEALAAK
ncbi:MAG: deoxyribose-phosphate aldolase [Bacteroidota bacterium]